MNSINNEQKIGYKKTKLGWILSALHICRNLSGKDIIKSFPRNVDKSEVSMYICTNRTRHASRQISVPGRVFYFYGYAV